MPSMAVWETEDETDVSVSVTAVAALPTPSDTPYRTPSKGSRSSKKSRRSVTPPLSSSTPGMPGTDKTDKTDKSSKRSSKDLATDETISIFDPRRFTPTLHANLVSEILALRRDQEEKMKIIESLETSLHASREEGDAAKLSLVTTAKENRSLKRQLALLEGGTSSALGELVRERDEALEAVNDTKKRLDTTQKRLRHHEEDLERSHEQFNREKETWEEERRKLERKIHVADARLKTVVEEVAAFHEAQVNGSNGVNGTNGADSEMEEGAMYSKDRDTDAASVRTMSMTNSVRFSVLPNKPNGASLADELNFGSDYDDETDHGGRESVLSYSNFHARNASRDSARDSIRDSIRDSVRDSTRDSTRDSIFSKSHRRNQSNDSLRRPGSVARGRYLNQTVLERLEGVIIREDEEDQQSVITTTAPAAPPPPPKVEYTDSAVQYSPPPSPKLPPQTAPQPLPVEPLPQLDFQAPPPPIPARADRSSITLHEATVESMCRGELVEIEANQRRKRVHIARPLTIEPVTVSSGLMVSVGSQTTAPVEPLSPPKTPKSFEKDMQSHVPPVPLTPPPPPPTPKPAMVCSSTQTDPPPAVPTPALPELSPNSSHFPSLVPAMAIPSISIHPPTSRPSTPRESLLPQQFKDFGCQVEISLPRVACQSVSVQTDEIRVDKRLDRLPPHLHPSAITSRPTSPAALVAMSGATDAATGMPEEHSRQFTPVPGNLPPRNPRRLATRSSITSEPPSSPPVPSPSAFGLEETHDAYPGNNDDGPLSSQKAPMRRPHRISSLFAGFDGVSSDEVDEFADADMSDSEFRTALSAPKPKSGTSRTGGKRTSVMSNGTTSPEQLTSYLRRGSVRNSVKTVNGATATELYSRFALVENKRDSRDSTLSQKSSLRSSRMSFERGNSVLGASNNRSSVMRKAAMIQNGIATHQGRSRSPSIPDARDPPFPIPTRASSRKPPISVSAPSDGQRSPTRGRDSWHRRGGSRSHYRANSIRKVRSAAAIPVKPRPRRSGSRSPPPPLGSAFSAEEEPESPGLPPLPSNDITAPRGGYSSTSTRYRSHHHHPSTNTANTEQTNQGSVNSANQSTGVVDAIAQTMVGEWMYKYVRRRKSFGGVDATSRDDSSNDRHKRWVWLAPYERAILWSSKQPSSNSTLMGKSGRKLTIQSVLDVKDDNLPPKGCPQLFNRSILILTPQRALKFTATTAERHYLWLTSLSFLAHSQQAVPENIAVPLQLPKTVPDFEIPRAKARKNPIRDSIRLTKSKTAMIQTSAGAVPMPPPPMSLDSSQIDSMPPSIPSYRPPESVVSAPSVAATSSTHQRDLSRDTAEPPVIARFHDRSGQVMVHGRKRSNTGGHVPPPLSFRGFSGPAGSNGSYHHASTNSTAGNSDISQSHSQASTNVTWGLIGANSSQRTSEASSRPGGPTMNNFFDAIGTVRMEAFISPLAFSQFDEYPDEQEEMRYRARRRSKELRRRASRSRHRDSYHSRGTRGTDDFYGGGSRTGGEEDYFRDDPFKGF